MEGCQVIRAKRFIGWEVVFPHHNPSCTFIKHFAVSLAVLCICSHLRWEKQQVACRIGWSGSLGYVLLEGVNCMLDLHSYA